VSRRSDLPQLNARRLARAGKRQFDVGLLVNLDGVADHWPPRAKVKEGDAVQARQEDQRGGTPSLYPGLEERLVEAVVLEPQDEERLAAVGIPEPSNITRAGYPADVSPVDLEPRERWAVDLEPVAELDEGLETDPEASELVGVAP